MSSARLSPGTVYLLGAGPGDPGLLTLRAKAVLEQADVVVYDYLANKAFLAFCRPDAEIVYVGKKGGNHTLPQDRINALLVDRALAGKTVARLKGGDPYVFGRGAEEAEELLAAGAKFEVVPGVTSAVAAPAYAGIPLTHRKYASSVSFITGHEDADKMESAHDWQALARSASTLVFFMGVKNLPDIAANLMAAGMDPKTPAALVFRGTTCRQRSIAATLETIAAAAEKATFSAPSLIIVGRVIELKDTLNFFERKPLLGKGVVVTRAREQASGLSDLLEEHGACVLQFPTIEIRPLPDYSRVHEAIGRLSEYHWIVFTSVNGVRHFWRELRTLGLDARAFGGRKIAAIGPATAAELEALGLVPDLVPDKYVAEDVVRGLLDLGAAGKAVLIPRAAEAREVLPEELARAGCSVQVLPVYETRPSEADKAEFLRMLDAGEIQYLTFASSSTVENFLALIPAETLRHHPEVKIAAIGPVTARTLDAHGLPVHVQPSDYTIPALVQALVEDAKR